MNKYFDKDTSLKESKKIEIGNLISKYTSDTNGNSMLGTIWTQSTSAIAGLTESVITPGFRTIKFVFGIMQIKKKLDHNLNTIRTKLKRVTNTLNSICGNGEYEHIRKSVIKMKTQKR